VKKILDITFSAGQTEINKICYSGIRHGLTLPRPNEANLYRSWDSCCFCVTIPLFGWLFHICLPNLIQFQVPYISMSLCAEKLCLNYSHGLGNTLLSQQRELRHEPASHNRHFGLWSTVSLALSFVIYRYTVPFLCIMCCMLQCNVSETAALLIHNRWWNIQDEHNNTPWFQVVIKSTLTGIFL
jgi:hypothetical protein